MAPVRTVISDPPETLTGYERELIDLVLEHGWQTTSVMAGKDGNPAFSYTTGLWLTAGQPEVVVFDFPPRLAHDVFGLILKKAREGRSFDLGKPVEGILSGE